jgi:hypothetical protein
MLSQLELAAYLGALRCSWFPRKQSFPLRRRAEKRWLCRGVAARRLRSQAKFSHERGRQKGFISGAICISILPALCFFVIHYSAGGLHPGMVHLGVCAPPKSHPAHHREHSISTQRRRRFYLHRVVCVCECVVCQPGGYISSTLFPQLCLARQHRNMYGALGCARNSC